METVIQAHHQDPLTRTYLAHYLKASQRGGRADYPVFRGSPSQSGRGLGDIIRRAAPLIGAAAGTFIDNAAGDIRRGLTLKKAAKRALRPTVLNALEAATKEFLPGDEDVVDQAGGGRRRKRRKRAHSRRCRDSATPMGSGGRAKKQKKTKRRKRRRRPKQRKTKQQQRGRGKKAHRRLYKRHGRPKRSALSRSEEAFPFRSNF